MSYKCSFLDNEIYGADDVSGAFSRLITGGVLLYPDTDTVAEALNVLNSHVIDAGVQTYDNLEVSITDNGAKVGKGVAFFGSGVSVEVDSDGATVEFEDGKPVYVSFVHYPELNCVSLKATEALPEGDFVLLAHIDSEKNITDMRTYAKAKVAINTANLYHRVTVQHTAWSRYTDNPMTGSQTVYKLPHTGFGYLLLMNASLGNFPYYPLGHIFDLSVEDEQFIYLNESNAKLYVKRSGDELKITSVYSNVTGAHTIELMLV